MNRHLALFIATLCGAAGAQVPFQVTQLANNAGDVKLVGDIDLDGTPDVVLGGGTSEGLNWYHYPSWALTRIATPAVEFTTDGELGDVDGDGDLDIVVPDGSSGNNLLWFENPARNAGRPDGNPFSPSQWTRHVIGSIGSWGKDIELADFDRDGRLDVATRSQSDCLIFFQGSAGTWSGQLITTSDLGQEGMTSGDVDKDGNVDLVVFGVWLRNPGGNAARNGANWSHHVVDAGSFVDPAFKALVADVDLDGENDILFSSSENTSDVMWFSHGGNPQRNGWLRHVIYANANRCHTLQVADVDRDGDKDVIVGQMHTSSTPGVRVFYNTNGAATNWQMQVVDNVNGVHNGVIADVGADGDLDLVGANWTGNPPLEVWENMLPSNQEILSVDDLLAGRSSAIRVTNANPNQVVVLWLTGSGTTTPYQTGLGTTFDLANPLLYQWGAAGSNGVADFEITAPVFLSGITIWFQSMEIGRKSNVVSRRVL
ncbi:MAG: VCBS repeat-containing protein [Planctomycetota bacterium]